ncbi:MAG: hypothetical protein NC347_10420 [Clostridium sp.]|nr:hypothetical protein [Clostridium sp.]
MNLYALNENFEVIHIKQTEQEYEILQCRAEDKKEEYTVLHFMNEEYVKKLLQPFFSLMDNHMYEDYKGCFTKENDLYLIFYRRKGIPLTELLQEKVLSAEQKIAIGKHVLEKILLWNLPDFMVCQLLCIDRILIDGEEVLFHYEWQQQALLEVDMKLVNEKAAVFIKQLFQREMEYFAAHGIEELAACFEEGKAEDVFAIYESYCSFLEGISVGEKEHVSGIERFRQELSKGIKRGLGILVFAAYFAAVWLLIQEIEARQKEKQEVKGVIFERIGNLNIQ